jgi:hypothetical protein
MQTFATARCRAFRHPEFRLRADPAAVLEGDIALLITTLEGMVSAGQRFKDGETIQVGWGTLRVRRNRDKSLSLLEPDFRKTPIKWVESVTTTILHLRRQKDVCESYFSASALLFPSLRESCITCTSLADADSVLMDRSEPRGGESGWFLGCADDDHDHNNPDHLTRLSLYKAALCSPVSIPFLALPSEVLLEVGADGVPSVLFSRGKRLKPRSGSYVATLAKRRRTRDPDRR